MEVSRMHTSQSFLFYFGESAAEATEELLPSLKNGAFVMASRAGGTIVTNFWSMANIWKREGILSTYEDGLSEHKIQLSERRQTIMNSREIYFGRWKVYDSC